MVSKREEYFNNIVDMSMLNSAGKEKTNTIIVPDDSTLPPMTEPKTAEYLQARAEQIFYQDFKASICRLNTALHSDYFSKAVRWIEQNILPDLSPAQIKSLKFRRSVMDKDTGKTLMQKFPAEGWLSWADVMKVKAFALSSFSMVKLVTATRSRVASEPIEIKKSWLS